jgi:hypothetical protein
MRAQRIRGRTALTIPFFVGCSRASLSRTTVSPQVARAEVHALLRSFLDDCPPDHAVSLYRCPDIGQPVAIEFFSVYSASDAVGLTSESQGRTTLYVASEFTTTGPSALTDLTELLFVELGSHICTSEFSYFLGNYVGFTSDDRDFIDFSRSL